MRFQDKVAIVTGGNSGMGKEVARRFVTEGGSVVVNGRTMRYKRGPAVDPADVMHDGSKFADVDEFKRLLLKDKAQLARALCALAKRSRQQQKNAEFKGFMEFQRSLPKKYSQAKQ